MKEGYLRGIFKVKAEGLANAKSLRQEPIWLSLRFFFFFFFVFLGPHPGHMEVPSLGVKSDLHMLLASTTARSDPRGVCHLHLSLRQHGILNPLSEARDS